MIHIITLFAQNYMARGLAMIESIQSQTKEPIQFTVLAMDHSTFSYLDSLKIPHWNVMGIQDFPDSDFNHLVASRPFRELCWTAASCLTEYVFKKDGESNFIVYVDADCYFFSGIDTLTSNWEDKNNIFVHEHRYSPERIQWATTAGRFNVGVVGFRGRSTEASLCLERWRNQVLEVCELNPELGHCGDQGYLNEWPQLYSGLQIMASPGEGAAPWNIEPLDAKSSDRNILIKNQLLSFYHFHALRLSFYSKLPILVSHLAYGYTIPKSVRDLVYRPYLKHLRKINRRLIRKEFELSDLGLTAVNTKEVIKLQNLKQFMFQVLI